MLPSKEAEAQFVNTDGCRPSAIRSGGGELRGAAASDVRETEFKDSTEVPFQILLPAVILVNEGIETTFSNNEGGTMEEESPKQTLERITKQAMDFADQIGQVQPEDTETVDAKKLEELRAQLKEEQQGLGYRHS